MKVGDLVKWTNPEALGFGLVVPLKRKNHGFLDHLNNHISVVWMDGQGSGIVPKDHKYLELVSESRQGR